MADFLALLRLLFWAAVVVSLLLYGFTWLEAYANPPAHPPVPCPLFQPRGMVDT
jgi:hypothetical protein